MEKQLNFVLKLTLEEMALRRVLVNQWNESDISTAIQDFRIKMDNPYHYKEAREEEEWKVSVEKKVKDKVSKLMLPESLKKQMMHRVRPIGYQILRWKSIHPEFQSAIPETLYWKSTGMVDNMKTAEKVVSLETFDVGKRYELACLYCLEDYIPLLWGELSEQHKRRYIGRLSRLLYEELPLEAYWALTLQGEESKLDFIGTRRFGADFSFDKYAFKFSARKGHKAATEYFFQKLNNEGRDTALLEAACATLTESGHHHFGTYSFRKENTSDVLCYLLSLMTTEQQMQVLKEYPHPVAANLLNWPWQDFFSDATDVIWAFLPKHDYKFMLRNICQNMTSIRYYFPTQMQTFFLRSPGDFRNNFLSFLSYFFLEFSNNEDGESIQVFLRSIDRECRKRLVYDTSFLDFLGKLMLKDKWHLVELCVQEVVLSKEDVKELKWTSSREFSAESYTGEILRRADKLKRFFQFLEETEARFPAL